MAAPLTDSRGLPVSTRSPETLEGYERALARYIGYAGDPLATIDEVPDRDPDFVLGRCLRTELNLLSTDGRSMPSVARDADALARLQGGALRRERAFDLLGVKHIL